MCVIGGAWNRKGMMKTCNSDKIPCFNLLIYMHGPFLFFFSKYLNIYTHTLTPLHFDGDTHSIKHSTLEMALVTLVVDILANNV